MRLVAVVEDGNLGYTQVLLKCFNAHTVRLLAALPTAWTNRHVTWETAKGNLIVDIYWENNR
ncbi:MAG: glycoside hydrolase family 95-like protein [Fidelibacterota bacterium]